MLVNRQKLENELRLVIGEYSANKKIKSSVSEYFMKRGMFESDALNIFAQRTPLETLLPIMLCIFTNALYEALGKMNSKLDPTKYFTEVELRVLQSDIAPKLSNKKTDKYPIIFSNVKQLNTNQWYTDLTAQEIAELYNKRVVTYNPTTQRQLKTKEQNGKIVTQIDVNKKSVQEIKQHLIEGKFFSNFITFNILENGEEDFILADGALKIYGGEIDIIDGFHRSLAIIDAVQENPQLDFKIGVVVTHFDTETAQRFIVQEDKRNKINTKYIKSLNLENKSNTIVKKINDNSQSYLRSKVTTDKNLIKMGKSLVMFDVLSDTIELVFNPKENIDVINYSKYLIEGLNIIIENNTELLKVVQDEKMWVYYLILLGELYGRENWEMRLLKGIENIDISRIEYSSINKSTISRIQKEMMVNV